MAVEFPTLITIYTLYFVSMVCSLTVATKLCTNEKNYLIGILAVGVALCELSVLSSVIWIRDFKNNVPKEFCIFQGLAIQYSAFLQIIAALCFSFHLYNLLVQNKDRMLQKVYNYILLVVPILMTIIAAIAAIENHAIKPIVITCDITTPVWVRILGYSGVNFILSAIGTYLSMRAAFEVITHLDRFKNRYTSSNDSNELPKEENTTMKKSYNLTKLAVMRMILFSCGFAIVNLGASVGTILAIVNGGSDEEEGGLRSVDIVASITGIIIYLIFGLPNWLERKILKLFGNND